MRFLISVIMLCAGLGCTAVNQPEPTPTATAVSISVQRTAVPTEQASSTPTPTPVPTATATPTAVATATFIPTSAAIDFPAYECPIETTGVTSSPPPLTDSLRVAFVGPDGIHLWRAETGASEIIYPANDVTALKMSDDGERIAFTRGEYEELELWVMDGDGRHPRLLVTAADLKARHAPEKPGYVIPRRLDWLPGSHLLAYTAIGHEEGLLVTFYDNLHLIDVDSGAITEALPAGSGGDFFFSPDGRYVALVNDTSLSLLDRENGDHRRDILTWEALGISHEYHRPRPAWTPDSCSLMLPVSNAKDNIDAAYNPDASSTLWRVDVDGAAPQEVTTFVGAPLGVDFSPDRNWVGYSRVDATPSRGRELHLAAVDNAWNIIYARGDNLHLQNWLPDSSGFVFRALTDDQVLLGRLCQEPIPLPLPETPNSFVREIEWIDPYRFLFTVDQPPQLFLGDLNGEQLLIGSLREEYFFGVGALSTFDTYP
jgi:hypothetical protein